VIIGVVAAAQRNYFSNSKANCAKLGTIAVTIVAGPLNHAGVNPASPARQGTWSGVNDSTVELLVPPHHRLVRDIAKQTAGEADNRVVIGAGGSMTDSSSQHNTVPERFTVAVPG
jgi:hypothetical protein